MNIREVFLISIFTQILGVIMPINRDKNKFLDLSAILPLVSRPARYIGNEWNSVHKNHGEIKVRVALAFPDVYEVGMSH
ncbi:hypothetical protein LR003_01965, partial [candidate division NPL-UPA2 bacterium]|nr:hypothetical protein [candidate division NPL-UPA2 bacterium]